MACVSVVAALKLWLLCGFFFVAFVFAFTMQTNKVRHQVWGIYSLSYFMFYDLHELRFIAL